ncbi:hypothetical protein HMPREF0454_00476 [Hafnia alvei ATCC 51873]|uniref:Uncharacterized protein n=1 Tax=Hafnia alvei ATCC 51873 TaxID=1002364 RepID=G9Y1Q9_HAFAL|nr:hypothetical protein HMPREF0454_00476 [Hafnia alvei ATCC 51873]
MVVDTMAELKFRSATPFIMRFNNDTFIFTRRRWLLCFFWPFLLS